LISFFDGRCPRWRVTFAVFTLAVGAASPLDAVAGRESGALLDIADSLAVLDLSSDSSSDGEGVGGKYSKFGESKSRAREAIE
jgi:hypothetical protein